jgi:hypothetical protein
MKGTEKSQTHDALLKLIEGHLSAHHMAKWGQAGVIERLGKLLVKRIYREFDVRFKEESNDGEPTTADGYNKMNEIDRSSDLRSHILSEGIKHHKEVGNTYGDDDYAVPVE